MGDAFRRSHHCVNGAFEGDPFRRQATHVLVCTHLSADQGASGDGIAAHAGDRSRNRAHARLRGDGRVGEPLTVSRWPGRPWEGAEGISEIVQDRCSLRSVLFVCDHGGSM
jgi:hypothetical protein